jgi:hypothetical protein
MSHRITLPSLLTGLFAVAALAACGTSATTSSSSGSSSTSSSSAAAATGMTAPTSAPATSAAAISTGACPSASTVGGALGVTLPAPTVVPPVAGATPLPGGAAGIACSYSAATASPPVVVIIALASGLPSGYLSTEEQKEVASLQAANINLNFTPLSGLGDEAATYQYTANGLTVEGVLAGQGGNFAGVFTEGTSASLSQIESLVKQLL